MVYKYLFEIMLSILSGIFYSVFEYISKNYTYSFFSILKGFLVLKDAYMTFLLVSSDINISLLGVQISAQDSCMRNKIKEI